jgi:tripartite motif-containing protein 71
MKTRNFTQKMVRALLAVMIMAFWVLTIPSVVYTAEPETYIFERMWPTLQQPWYFYYPYDVATDNQGYVYVVDKNNDCIQKFTSNGQFVSKWGKHGYGEGELIDPSGIEIDSHGFLYVVDAGRRIQKFTSNGQFVSKWGKYERGEGELIGPSAIGIDSHGFIYVAEELSRIQKFTIDGHFVTKWGSIGGGDGEFRQPSGIEIDIHGFVYVADTNNHRIQKFTPDGQFITKWGGRGAGDGLFQYPREMHIEPTHKPKIFRKKLQNFKFNFLNLINVL